LRLHSRGSRVVRGLAHRPRLGLAWWCSAVVQRALVL